MQESPAPEMVPAPAPLKAAPSGSVLGSNFADTCFAAFKVSVQDLGAPAATVHPDQLLNTEPMPGDAASETVA